MSGGRILAKKRVNIGCGQTPIPGWCNYDNSLSVRLGRCPTVLTHVLEKLGLIGDAQKRFIAFSRKNDILWADATRRIPLRDNSVEVLYASHMVEHLDREEVKIFLNEAMRVLAPKGIIRIAVPDLRRLANQYISDGDADVFMQRTHLGRLRPKSLVSKIKYLIVGDRQHLWMYDGRSLARLLSEAGFEAPRVLEPGSTGIPNPGNLDLYERASDSLYVEARRP